MIRINITQEAWAALGGSDKPEAQAPRWERGGCDESGYYLWLTPQVATLLGHARLPGESSADTILRLAREEEAA